MTYILIFRPLSCLQAKIYAYGKVDIQSDFSILSDPILQNLMVYIRKRLSSAFQWYKPFEKMLRPSPSVRAVNEKFHSDASLRSELVMYLDWHLLWRHGGGLFEPKYGWKMIDLGPKTWFSVFGPFYDVIKGVILGQKSPKCVFLYS